jgi:hypothetical protein
MSSPIKGTLTLSANRGVFSRLVSSTSETNTIDVLESLSVSNAKILTFTNIPNLPLVPTQQKHIINKEFAEGLVRVALSEIVTSAPPFQSRITLTSVLNNLFVLLPPVTNANIDHVEARIHFASPDFCRFRLVNTTTFPLHVYCALPTNLIYSVLFNPTGAQPLIVNQKTQIEFTRIENDWYTTIS